MAMIMLIPAGPVIALLAIMVRATSRGAAFYTQERSGLGGKPFQIFKIRTMRRDAEAPGQAVWSTRGDTRVTTIGRALRFLHLDELPQLLNIARGEMAFIGPRPERPQIVDELADSVPGYVQRLQVLPGVTGLAQINLNPDESIECVRKKLVLDCLYIASASRDLDARIMICTALRMIGIRHGIAAKLMGVRFRFDDAGRLLHGNVPLEANWSLQAPALRRKVRRQPAPILVGAQNEASEAFESHNGGSAASNLDRSREVATAMVGRLSNGGVVVRPK